MTDLLAEECRVNAVWGVRLEADMTEVLTLADVMGMSTSSHRCWLPLVDGAAKETSAEVDAQNPILRNIR